MLVVYCFARDLNRTSRRPCRPSQSVAERAPRALITPLKEDAVSAPRWPWPLIGIWVALAFVSFFVVEMTTMRSWPLLLVAVTIPPAMLLWLWNEERRLRLALVRR